MTATLNDSRRVGIIGTGFSGLCIAIHLKKRGHHNFVMFDKGAGLGGTWRDNTYPGAECDTPSVLYSFSFEPKADWAYKWSEQPQILEYMEHCADKYELRPHMQFDQRITSLVFDESNNKWTLKTDAGLSEEFDVIVSGVGQLHKPWRPEIEGADDFTGNIFHSAQWDHDVSLDGKKVCCIGNAASAVQFIPQIAPKCASLHVFQRSANWILPKNDRAYKEFEKALYKMVPPIQSVQRFWNWFRGDGLLYPLMSMKSERTRQKTEQMTKDYINEKIRDPELREKLVPDYPMGAKRILFTDDFFDALDRDNVELITSHIERIESNGIRSKDGELHEADVIIYATGFETTTFLTPMKVQGVGGEMLNEKWDREGAEAYLGITHTGFPNFFMMYGPNTNLGHNSIIVMIEAQTRYILSCLEQLDSRSANRLDVKETVQKTYNQWVQERLHDSVWANVDHSWYKDDQGKITNNWVGRTSEYRRKTKTMNPEDYEFV